MNTEKALSDLRSVLRLRHYSYRTEQNYSGWLSRFAGYLKRAGNIQTSEQRVEAFLTWIAKKGYSASTQNQAFNALCFFYREVLGRPLKKVNSLRAKTGKHVRVAPSMDEMRRILPSIENVYGYPTNLLGRLLYGCGLRVSEAVNLRIRDLSFSNSQIVIRGAKGNKDRIVPLPCSLIVDLRAQVERSRGLWKMDLAKKIPVTLPHRLAAKYPKSRFAWDWFWLFPGMKPCRHPRTAETVRFHIHENYIQKAVKAAGRACGLSITPHYFRHAYATHTLEIGSNVRAVQSALGHKSLETTMGYLTPDAMAAKSPLDRMEAAPA